MLLILIAVLRILHKKNEVKTPVANSACDTCSVPTDADEAKAPLPKVDPTLCQPSLRPSSNADDSCDSCPNDEVVEKSGPSLRLCTSDSGAFQPSAQEDLRYAQQENRI